MAIPEGFPEMPQSADNTFTKARWDLGKKLFFDPILSRDSSISCGTCHKPQLAFSDNTAFSDGVEQRAGTRNSSSLANIGYHPYYLREGGIPTLEMQTLVPIQEHNEFDHDMLKIIEKLSKKTDYGLMATKAYNKPIDAFVITRALGVFQRSLISGNSRYDQFINADPGSFTEIEKTGKELFFGAKAQCSQCHGGFNFTDYSFQNNGLYTTYADNGRERLTNNEADRALFKVPSLRNIALTAPYMHDGSLASLKEVIEHYNNGGKPHNNKNSLVTPLHLSNSEQEALVAFLQTLSDYSFINNPNFTPAE